MYVCGGVCAHIAPPGHVEFSEIKGNCLLFAVLFPAFKNEFIGKYVGELRSEAISPADDFFLCVVVVAAC